jgi:DNA-binding CsgD family transcriptional regulator/tetratricopeptide (TPR) repeat protein
MSDRASLRVGLTSRETGQALALARASYARREWDDAFRALERLDAVVPLAAEDLDRLAWTAALTARDDAMLPALERLHDTRLAQGERAGAARAALWLGFRLFARGESSRASAWLARCQRLADEMSGGSDQGCVEQGYLMLPRATGCLVRGDAASAQAAAAQGVAVAQRFQDPDLFAFAANLEGRAWLALGELQRGLAQMDEAMVRVMSGSLAPIVTGLVYCSAIASAQRVFAFERTREWTAGLDRWCRTQPQLVMFQGHCLVHRAQILRLEGRWPEAMQEARLALQRCAGEFDAEAAGLAHYELAEVHRLRGETEAAEAAYREASRRGVDPLPGLPLLRESQGDADGAIAALRRFVDTKREPLDRARCLPALVEAQAVHGDVDGARASMAELQLTAARCRMPVLAALAEHAAAALDLADERWREVPERIAAAAATWRTLPAPFLLSQGRVLLARAYLGLGDAEGAALELDGAAEVFRRLVATPSLASVDALRERCRGTREAVKPPFGLTPRELEVLRLVATGRTNKQVARELALSAKTIDRHLSNIFGKLAVSTRAAATALAHQRGLV